MGEIQALSWSEVDLNDARIHIRRSYVRKERCFKDYPKGRKQHSHAIPTELLRYLFKVQRKGSYVVSSPAGEMLSYEGYFHWLKRYCKECGIRVVGTHGLRHSTAALYLSHGASRDDIRQLFAHSSAAITDRYVHYRGSHLEKVAGLIKVFPAHEVPAGG